MRGAITIVRQTRIVKADWCPRWLQAGTTAGGVHPRAGQGVPADLYKSSLAGLKEHGLKGERTGTCMAVGKVCFVPSA